MAEVFALDEDRVLKLDRPEWSGVSEFERDVITRVAASGLPVARAHGMMTVDGRRGVVLDHIHGRSLQDELAVWHRRGRPSSVRSCAPSMTGTAAFATSTSIHTT